MRHFQRIFLIIVNSEQTVDMFWDSDGRRCGSGSQNSLLINTSEWLPGVKWTPVYPSVLEQKTAIFN